MIRVPGSSKDLMQIRSTGADVRVVYSPLDALKIAQDNPNKEVVFFAIGFETTAPANAMVVYQAKEQQINNFSIIVSHVLVPPAIRAILSSDSNRVQGFLAAGHVCAVMGFWEYIPLSKEFNIPIVVTGFEPIDLLKGIHRCIQLLETGQNITKNEYSRVVSEQGNQHAQKLISKVFEVCDRKWRGIGTIPQSGWKLNSKYADYDAELKFDVSAISVPEPESCIAGLILQGIKKPPDCPEFKENCTPDNPMGATMVSNEGACSAYYRYSLE
jgi:hydrogenase expression/formation protein HypD